MTKLLVVEDEPGLVEILKYNLERQNFYVAFCRDGAKFRTCFKKEQPDLILMDWMLPNISGIDLCRWVRQESHFHAIPIIMLTARSDESDKVKGLTIGADDYMTKPFSIPELLARIQALLRRTHSQQNRCLTAGILRMNLDHRQVFLKGKAVHLGPTEFHLLSVLMAQAGRVLSRADLLKIVWANQPCIADRTVDVHIRRLRKALNGHGDLIRTVRSSGYAINIDKN